MKALHEIEATSEFWHWVANKIADSKEGYVWCEMYDSTKTILESRTFGLHALGREEVFIDFRAMREVPDVQTRKGWLSMLKEGVADAITTDVGIPYWLEAHYNWMFSGVHTEEAKVGEVGIYKTDYRLYKIAIVEVAG